MGFGKNNTGALLRENPSVALSTLASGVALKLTGSITPTEDFRMLKAEIGAGITGLTGNEGNQIFFGLCNGELTAAEIEEAIEAVGPTDRNDRLLVERAERFVKILSKTNRFENGQTEREFMNESGGPIIVTKPRWTFSNTEGWDWFVYNNGLNALTTGATVRALATIYGLWLT